MEDLNNLTKNALRKLKEQEEIDKNEEPVKDLYADFKSDSQDDEPLYDNRVVLKTNQEESFDNPKIDNVPPEDYLEERDALLEYDEPLFPDGPTKTQIDSWKKQWLNYDIFVTEILGQYFVFRTLNRFEYKQLIALQNIDALQREEIINETTTLWPNNYKWDKMATGKAGIPSTLAKIIMEKSGFINDYSIQVL